VYFNLLIVLFSVAYEVWLGVRARLSPLNCLWLCFLSISANGLEAVNVSTLLILALHARMYRKISKVYFRVTKSSLKLRGVISELFIYREMVDKAFYKLSRLSHTVSVMALGLIFLLIVIVAFALISPIRRIHNTFVYTFLLGILVTAIWGYFVGHSISGVFDSVILPFVHLRQHFLHTQKGDCSTDRMERFNWLYIQDMLQVAEICGFAHVQVDYIRQACELFEEHKEDIKFSLKRIGMSRSPSKQNIKDIFLNVNRSSLEEFAKTTRVGKRLFMGGSITSTVSSASDSPRNSGCTAAQYLRDYILSMDSNYESSQKVPAQMQKLLSKMNTTVERFYPKAIETLLSQIPEEFKGMDNLEEAVNAWSSIRGSKEFQKQLKSELLGQDELLKKHILAAVMKRISNTEVLKWLSNPAAEDNDTSLLDLLIGVLEENAQELQVQISEIVQRILAKITPYQKLD